MVESKLFSIDAHITSRPAGIDRSFKPFAEGATREEVEQELKNKVERERRKIEAEGKQFNIELTSDNNELNSIMESVSPKNDR